MEDIAKKESVTVVLFVVTIVIAVVAVLSTLSFGGTKEGCDGDFVCESDRKEDTVYKCFAPTTWDCCKDDSDNTVDCNAIYSVGEEIRASAKVSQCNPKAFTLPLCKDNGYCNVEENCLTATGDCACPQGSLCDLTDVGYACACENDLTNKCEIVDGVYVCEC